MSRITSKIWKYKPIMFCALHVVVAFGVLLVVCSLVRANAVRFHVQLRRAQFKSSGPAAVSFSFSLFSLLPSPRVLTSFPCRWNSLLPACVPRCSLCLPRLPWRSPRLVFPLPLPVFPPVGIRRSLHVFHVARSVCSACLGESPPGSPFLLFISLLSSVANQASESCFSRRILPESEVGAVHPFSKIRELWFVPVSQALVLLSCSKYLLSFPDFCCMFFQALRSVPNFFAVESQTSFAVSLLLQAVVSAPPCSCFPRQPSLGKCLSTSCVLPPLDFSFCALLLRLR